LVELEDARQKASNLDQLSAAVRAIEAKAKISGLLTRRIEVTEGNEFAGCETMGEHQRPRQSQRRPSQRSSSLQRGHDFHQLVPVRCRGTGKTGGGGYLFISGTASAEHAVAQIGDAIF
jgi:hypothetical protein